MGVTSLVAKLSFVAALGCAMLVASCDINKEPKPRDPGPFLGCYDDGGIRLHLMQDHHTINDKPFKYSIEFRKVGLILSSDFNIIALPDGGISVSKANYPMFYRIDRADNVPVIIVADSDSRVYNLKMRSNNC